jgi:hypothetical protein
MDLTPMFNVNRRDVVIGLARLVAKSNVEGLLAQCDEGRAALTADGIRMYGLSGEAVLAIITNMLPEIVHEAELVQDRIGGIVEIIERSINPTTKDTPNTTLAGSTQEDKVMT